MTGPVQLIPPGRHGDVRGWFTETYNRDIFARLEIACTFIQDNHPRSTPAFTLRDLHFQTPPRAVDTRAGSLTYGRWVGAELSADSGHQLFAAAGFAHGIVTLERDCEVVYRCSDTYAPDQDGGIRWDDPAIGSEAGIAWPIPVGTTSELSEKDQHLLGLDDFYSPSPCDGRPLIRLS